MLKETLWSQNVPRVELDQRARDARLRHSIHLVGHDRLLGGL